MCVHVLLVFFDNRLSWITNVSHLRTPVVKSSLSVLHVLVVRLAVYLNVIPITRRTQRTVAHELAFTTEWSYGFCSLGPVFHASFSSVYNLMDCVNLHGFVLDWRSGT